MANAELKKILGRVKTAQNQLETMLKDRTWIEDARKYAERQGKEVKKLLTSDVSKVKTFLERERKELEKFQKQIPGEVKKLQKFVEEQRSELQKLIANARKAGKATPAKKKSTGGAKKRSTKKAATSASSSGSAN